LINKPNSEEKETLILLNNNNNKKIFILKLIQTLQDSTLLITNIRKYMDILTNQLEIKLSKAEDEQLIEIYLIRNLMIKIHF